MSNEELKLSRDMGAATYLSSYIHLMAEQLEITDGLTNDSVNAMAALMVEPLNLATEATFRYLMNDHKGGNRVMQQLHLALVDLPPML